jgi:hypothetical protein
MRRVDGIFVPFRMLIPRIHCCRERRAKTAAHQRLIIRDANSDHECALIVGIVPRMMNPPLSGLPMESSPPNIVKRSRMPARPPPSTKRPPRPDKKTPFIC